jgi:signal transduction histidine kinase
MVATVALIPSNVSTSRTIISYLIPIAQLTRVCVGSPLHGILAGVEMLQDSQLSPFQEEMSISVAMAGRTLLDTVNHILDYSKISNLTRDQKRDRARIDTSRHQSANVRESNTDQDLVTVDLARLTEEILESVVSANRFSQSFGQTAMDTDEPLHSTTSSTLDESEGVSVVLDIQKRTSWITRMTLGSWTRVLTNIGKHTHEIGLHARAYDLCL